MNALALDISYEGRPIRVVGSPDNPLFVAADVCRVIDLGNVTEATRGLDPDERGSEILNTPGGPQETLVVTEPGLYALLARSRKPEARKFDRWVRHDILPTIRRHGCYPAPSAVVVGTNRAIVRLDTEAVMSHLESIDGRLVSIESRLGSVETGVSEVRRHLERVPVIRKEIPRPVQDHALLVVAKKYGGACPCCERVQILSQDGRPLANLRFDHWTSRGKVGANEVWPVCEDCNIELGEPGHTPARGLKNHMFLSYQSRRELVRKVPAHLLGPTLFDPDGGSGS